MLPFSVTAGEYSALISFSTNHPYRGYSKTGNTTSLRGNAEYSPNSWFFVGTWISQVDFEDREFNDRASVEFYPYLGVNFKVAENWQWESAVSRYVYDGRLFGKHSDYNEYSMAVHYRDLLTTRIAVADDVYHRGGYAIDYELSGRYPIARNLEASAGIGYNNARRVLEYDTLYWNAGATWFFRYGSVDFRYVDASHFATSHRSDALVLPYLEDTFVFSLSLGF